MKKKIETQNAPQPGKTSYSQAIEQAGLIFTAGQIHLTPDGTLLEGTIEEQTEQVMQNLKAVLEAAGSSFANVLKTTVYVTDMSNYAAVNATYAKHMPEPYPARETVCVKELPLGAKVEISMVAGKEG